MARHVAQSIYVAHISQLLSRVSWSNGNVGLGSTVPNSRSWSQPVRRYVAVVASYVCDDIDVA